MNKFKELKSVKYLVIGLVCFFCFFVPTFILWITDPTPTSWYWAGFIALLLASFANLKRFFQDNRKY